MYKVLLIVDSTYVRENTARILRELKYRVKTACDGSEGLDSARRWQPDVVICDVHLPQMNNGEVMSSREVLKAFRNHQETKRLPFIFLTHPEETPNSELTDLTPDAYISKPFESSHLHTTITDLLIKSGNPVSALSRTSLLPEHLICNVKSALYYKNQFIYREKSHADHLFYVQRGQVKAYRQTDDGREMILGFYKKGDLFGFEGFFSGSRYIDSAEAIDQTTLSLIPKPAFDQWLGTDPSANNKIYSLLSERINELESRLSIMAYSSVRKKVANALLLILHKYPGNIRISRENLANLAGTATETLIRTLSQFKSEKMIDIRKTVISVIDENKLKKIDR